MVAKHGLGEPKLHGSHRGWVGIAGSTSMRPVTHVAVAFLFPTRRHASTNRSVER